MSHCTTAHGHQLQKDMGTQKKGMSRWQPCVREMRGGEQKIQTGRLWLLGRLLTDSIQPRRDEREQAAKIQGVGRRRGDRDEDRMVRRSERTTKTSTM